MRWRDAFDATALPSHPGFAIDRLAICQSVPGHPAWRAVDWFWSLQINSPIAHGMLVLCAVVACGLSLGALKIRGVGLGVAGVLFSGLAFGHFGLNIDAGVRHFLQEFGLILFVYTIGMQVGPGFLDSLRRHGLSLNLAAAAIVILGAAITLGLSRLLRIDMVAAVGIFAGATTNTPALGAAQEALKNIPGITPESSALPGLGYAVAYPFGILGIIIAMLLIRALFRINVPGELEAFRAAQRSGQSPVQRVSLVVENANLDGMRLREIPGLASGGVVISRVRRAGAAEVAAATPDTVLRVGDSVVAVGEAPRVEELRVVMGRRAEEDLTIAPGPVRQRRIIVTHRPMVGRTIRELSVHTLAGVTITRMTRAGVELSVAPDRRLQFGDMLMAVGTEEDLGRARAALGDSVQQLNHTSLIPIFVGIALGVLVGSYPISIGGMPAPLRLGLAGGPLLVAIILSRVGRVGPLLWHMPVNANFLLREIGITLFLSCVGLKAGSQFAQTLLDGDGLLWMACGAVVTLAPLLLVGLALRAIWSTNYLAICGLLSGSMTDPPALAFANGVTNSDAPSVAYATVYPLTMLLRIVLAQVLVLFFAG